MDSSDKKGLLQLIFVLLACSGVAALINGITGSAQPALIAFVALFAFCLAKGDQIFS